MNVTIHFFTYRSYDSHLCGKSTAIIIEILSFCDIRAVVFLQSYVIMPVSRSRKTENWSSTAIISTLAWVNSWHFVWRNQCLETSAEIPHWWRVITQIWVVFLIGWSKFSTCTTNQRPYTHPYLGGDASSVCARFSDVISRGNQRWSCEMSAVFRVYFYTKNKLLHVTYSSFHP